MRQHTLGVMGYIIWVLFTIYSSFQKLKNFENRLGSKVLTSYRHQLAVHFLGDVYI